MIVQRRSAWLILVLLMLSSTACSAQPREEEAVPISTEWVFAHAACHEFAASLVQPIVVNQDDISSVSTLWSQVSGTDSKFKEIVMRTAHEKRLRALTSPKEIFEVFDQVSSMMEGYPGDECDPLFHELVAERLYLQLTNGDESNVPDKVASVPVGRAMQRRRRLLELLIEEASKAVAPP